MKLFVTFAILGISLIVLISQAMAEGLQNQEERIRRLEEHVQTLATQNQELRQKLEQLTKAEDERERIPEVIEKEIEAREKKGTRTKKESWVKYYGFLRLDSIYSDSKPDHPQFPFWILSEDRRRGQRKDDDEQFNMHPRLTRLGLDFIGPEDVIGPADLTGNFEVDFQNGGKESRQIIRIRHAYLQLKAGKFSLLAGQTWDIISPLFPMVNNDSLMWNTGNLGDRRPQIRLTWEPDLGPGTLSLVGGFGLGGAIDAQDLDGDSVRDAEDWGQPHYQGRIAYSLPLWVKEKKATLGLWGHFGKQELEKKLVSKDEFDTYSFGLDLTLPLTNRFTFKGEFWQGQNLADYRGGIGQGINSATADEIDSEGGWVELHCQLLPSLALATGYTIDNPDDGDVPDKGRTKNESFYLTSRWSYKNFTLGLDYINWTTDWKGLDDGDANRFNLIFHYDF